MFIVKSRGVGVFGDIFSLYLWWYTVTVESGENKTHYGDDFLNVIQHSQIQYILSHLEIQESTHS